MMERGFTARSGRVVLCAAGLLTAFLWSSAAMGQTVVFDQGPTTGTVTTCWSNYTANQNFADKARLLAPTKITAIIIFTCEPPVAATVHVKILSDNGSGAPGSVLYAEDKTPDAWVADAASGGYKVTVQLTTPFVADAGVTYWYGVSGNGFELGQFGVSSPGDGQMAQFSGSTYNHSAGIGDQMFQLLGEPAEAIPVLGSWGSAALALLVAVAGFFFIRRLR